MPRKRKQRGKGKALDWIKKTAKNIHDYAKDKRLVSRGLSALASSGLTPYSAGLTRASVLASNLGYGKSKTRKKGGAKKKPGRPRKVGRPKGT